MPFKSTSQRKFMYSQHPELAQEFESKTPKGKKLPDRVSKPANKGRHKEVLQKAKSAAVHDMALYLQHLANLVPTSHVVKRASISNMSHELIHGATLKEALQRTYPGLAAPGVIKLANALIQGLAERYAVLRKSAEECTPTQSMLKPAPTGEERKEYKVGPSGSFQGQRQASPAEIGKQAASGSVPARMLPTGKRGGTPGLGKPGFLNAGVSAPTSLGKLAAGMGMPDYGNFSEQNINDLQAALGGGQAQPTPPTVPPSASPSSAPMTAPFKPTLWHPYPPGQGPQPYPEPKPRPTGPQPGQPGYLESLQPKPIAGPPKPPVPGPPPDTYPGAGNGNWLSAINGQPEAPAMGGGIPEEVGGLGNVSEIHSQSQGTGHGVYNADPPPAFGSMSEMLARRDQMKADPSSGPNAPWSGEAGAMMPAMPPRPPQVLPDPKAWLAGTPGPAPDATPEVRPPVNTIGATEQDISDINQAIPGGLNPNIPPTRPSRNPADFRSVAERPGATPPRPATPPAAMPPSDELSPGQLASRAQYGAPTSPGHQAPAPAPAPAPQPQINEVAQMGDAGPEQQATKAQLAPPPQGPPQPQGDVGPEQTATAQQTPPAAPAPPVQAPAPPQPAPQPQSGLASISNIHAQGGPRSDYFSRLIGKAEAGGNQNEVRRLTSMRDAQPSARQQQGNQRWFGDRESLATHQQNQVQNGQQAIAANRPPAPAAPQPAPMPKPGGAAGSSGPTFAGPGGKNLPIHSPPAGGFNAGGVRNKPMKGFL